MTERKIKIIQIILMLFVIISITTWIYFYIKAIETLIK